MVDGYRSEDYYSPFFFVVLFGVAAVLVDADFETRIYRINANFFFGPDISLTNYVQYDNVTRKMGWQTRFRWILKPGNEILFAWNSSIFEAPEKDRFEVQQSTTRLKLNYNIRF